MTVNTNFTPWETKKFKAFWWDYQGYLSCPIDWRRYFEKSSYGYYFVLIDKADNGLIMCNSFLECQSNQEIIHQAEGDVMVVGLGINLINDCVLDLPQVDSVLTVEFYQDVIDNVPTRTEVIKRDARDKFFLPLGRKFDVIYVDPYCSHRMDDFLHHLKPGGQLLSWRLNYVG